MTKTWALGIKEGQGLYEFVKEKVTQLNVRI